MNLFDSDQQLENLLKSSFNFQKKNITKTLSANFQKEIRVKIQNINNKKISSFSLAHKIQSNLMGLKLFFSHRFFLYGYSFKFNNLLVLFLLTISTFLLIFFTDMISPFKPPSTLIQPNKVGYPSGIRFLEKEPMEKSKKDGKMIYFYIFNQNRETENKTLNVGEDSNPRLHLTPVFWHIPGLINQCGNDR